MSVETIRNHILDTAEHFEFVQSIIDELIDIEDDSVHHLTQFFRKLRDEWVLMAAKLTAEEQILAHREILDALDSLLCDIEQPLFDWETVDDATSKRVDEILAQVGVFLLLSLLQRKFDESIERWKSPEHIALYKRFNH